MTIYYKEIGRDVKGNSNLGILWMPAKFRNKYSDSAY
jgi:hypothetical protein